MIATSGEGGKVNIFYNDFLTFKPTQFFFKASCEGRQLINGNINFHGKKIISEIENI